MSLRAAALLCALLLTGATSWAGILSYEVTSLSPSDPTLFRYTYSITGFTFMANQELDVEFQPGLYTQLSNAVASPDFDVQIFQPNDPLGLYGDYTALAKVDSPQITTFSVDFKYLGVGLPGSQPFNINQFNQDHVLTDTLLSGATTATPEPGTAALCGLMLVIVGVCRAALRRSPKKV